MFDRASVPFQLILMEKQGAEWMRIDFGVILVGIE
jgi:hypothetical protein